MPVGNTYPARPGGLQGDEKFIIFTTTDTYNCTLTNVQTFLNLSQYALATHNHALVYEPIITKSTGYVKWTGSAWSFVNEVYSLSSHTHAGVYEPVVSKSTGYATWTGAAWSFLNETYSLSSHDHTGVYSIVAHTHSGVYEPVLGFTAENITNKVTSISGSSTDVQYGSAKLLYDQLTLKASLAGATFSGAIVGTTIQAQVKRTIQSTTSTATFTHNCDSYDSGQITAQTEALSMAAPTGTPFNLQTFVMYIKDNSTSRAISWNSAFAAFGTALPSVTVLGKAMSMVFMYHTAMSNKWCLMSLAQE